MDLTSLLAPDLVKVSLAARGKMEAVSELVDFLIARGKIAPKDRREVLDAVEARENSLSTGMEHGIALPHGSVGCVPELVGALGISHAGIDFATLDGKPAHLIVCLVVPRQKKTRHVRTLAGIARLLNNESLRHSLLTATTPEEAMALMSAEEAEAVRDSTLEDLEP